MVTELNMATAIKAHDLWFDSGATIHVCINRQHFKSYIKLEDLEEVLMENHVTAKVQGKEIIELNFTCGHKLIIESL